jgi:hypothetical protein
MNVHIQIQRATKPLDDRDRPATPVGHAITPRTAAQEPQYRTQIHRHDRATEIVIPGEEIPDPIRQTQDPLPHGHFWKDVIDQVRRSLRHAPSAATGAEAAPLTGEGHESVVAARRTAEPSESTRQAAAPEKFAELLFDEPRQAFAVAERRRLCAERLEVFEDDLVKHALSGIPRLIAARRLGHSGSAGGRHANR